MNYYPALVFFFTLASLTAFSQSHVDGVAATVNGEVITFSEVRRELEHLRQQSPGTFLKQEQTLGRLGLLRHVTRNLVEEELLFAEVENRGVTLPKDYLDRRLQTLVDERFGGDWKKLTASLLDTGQTLDDYRAVVGKQLAARMLVDELVNRRVVITARDVADYYTANPETFQVPERVRLSLIFLPRKIGESDAELDRRVAALNQELAAGSAFETIAKARSADSTAADGGDLGWQHLNDLSKRYRDAVADVPANTLAPVIKEPAGAHLLKVVDRDAARTLPLDEPVKKEIETILFRQRRDILYKELIADLREKYYVKNFVNDTLPLEK
ncbi:MAG: peptidylprolyl isomerase [Lentisphaeria bacterium]|nr:peptidylprolyl isomerase [Lentisphaeria bacterium]